MARSNHRLYWPRRSASFHITYYFLKQDGQTGFGSMVFIVSRKWPFRPVLDSDGLSNIKTKILKSMADQDVSQVLLINVQRLPV